jgi:hypothetical protein
VVRDLYFPSRFTYWGSCAVCYLFIALRGMGKVKRENRERKNVGLQDSKRSRVAGEDRI